MRPILKPTGLRQPRSLGTSVMAAQDKRWDSSDSDDESVGMYPPQPPRATATVRTRSVLVVDDGVNGFDDNRAVPVATMPPMPPMPESPIMARSPVEGGLGLARSKSRRKTLKEIIDGWWDLGLLEQRRK